MAKINAAGVELKVRIPGELMERVNAFRFAQQLETKKDAVIRLLESGLRAGGTETSTGNDNALSTP